MVKVFSLILLLLAPLGILAADITLRSDRNPVSLNESFQLIYESEDDVDDDPDFSVLETHLDILNRGQSSNISIINGRYSSKKTWTLTVMARQQGKQDLPPVPFGDDASPGLTLEVKAASQNPSQQDEFFSRVRVSESSVYVQQQLLVTQQLFSAYNLSAYGLGDLSFDGIDVVVEPLGDEKQYRTHIGGKAYIVVEKQYALFPQQSGELQILPALAEGQAGSRSGSLFDPFGSRGKVFRARSQASKIEVLSVPAEAKMNPWLPATEFVMLEQWPKDPPEFIVGEPITRTVSIKAEGLSAAQLPVLPQDPIGGVKQYPDQPMLENIRNSNGLSGYRVEKVAFIPTRPGQLMLPAIEIPWWDIKTQSRQLARIPRREINVAPAATSQDIRTNDKQPVTEPVELKPQPIQPAAPPASVQVPVLDTAKDSLWLWVAVIALLGWLSTVVSWFLFSRSRKNSQPAANKQNQQDCRRLLQAISNACRHNDLPACRAALLDWGRVYFADQQVQTLSDLAARLPQSLADILRSIDARLYGGSAQTVEIDQVPGLLDQLVRQQEDDGKIQSTDLLEPLYK